MGSFTKLGVRHAETILSSPYTGVLTHASMHIFAMSVGSSVPYRAAEGTACISTLTPCRFPEVAQLVAPASGKQAEGSSMGAHGRVAFLWAASRPAVIPPEAKPGCACARMVP